MEFDSLWEIARTVGVVVLLAGLVFVVSLMSHMGSDEHPRVFGAKSDRRWGLAVGFRVERDSRPGAPLPIRLRPCGVGIGDSGASAGLTDYQARELAADLRKAANFKDSEAGTVPIGAIGDLAVYRRLGRGNEFWVIVEWVDTSFIAFRTFRVYFRPSAAGVLAIHLLRLARRPKSAASVEGGELREPAP